MTHRTKQIVAAAFTTLIAVVTLAVEMDVVPEAKVKLAMFGVAALSLVNSLFLPAVLGKVPGKSTTTVLVVFAALGLSGCECWQPTSPKYTTPGCLLARGIVDCAKDVATAEFESAMSQVGAITSGTNPDDVKQKLLSDLESSGGNAALCAIAAVAEALSGRKFASVSGPPVVTAYLRAKHAGQVVIGLPGDKALSVR